MNRKTISTATLVATAPTAGMILSGCSNDPAPSNTTTVAAPTDTTTPAGTPVAEPTTPAAPTFKAGDKITEAEAELLPETQTTYTSSTGKIIVVDLEKKGLPKSVTKDIAQRAKAAHDNENTVLTGERTSAEAGNISREIGKNVVIIYRGMGNIGFHSTGAPRITWYAAGTTDRLKATYSKDEQVAAVKKWIKKQDEEWVLVVRAD